MDQSDPSSQFSSQKLLIILVVVTIVISFLAAGFIFFQKSKPTNSQTSIFDNLNSSSNPQTQAETFTPRPVPATLPSPQEASTPIPAESTDTASVSALKKMVSDLQNQINQLKLILAQQNSVQTTANQTTLLASSSPASITNTQKPPVYIPVGSSDSFNNTAWQSIEALSVWVDTNSYPGYTGVQLEVSLRMNAGGTVTAQLYNDSLGIAVGNSTVSTNTTTFKYLRSGNFNLSAGNNLYKIQVKNDSGDASFLQNARLRISF